MSADAGQREVVAGEMSVKVDVLADTKEEDDLVSRMARVEVTDDTVVTPTKLTLSCHSETPQELADHFPKSIIKKKSDESILLGRNDGADVFLNHSSMSKMYGSIRYDNTQPYTFYIKNLSKTKLIEVTRFREKKKKTECLKYEEEILFEDKAVLKFHTVEFQARVMAGDLHAMFYEVEVQKVEVQSLDLNHYQHAHPVHTATPCPSHFGERGPGHSYPISSIPGGPIGAMSTNFMMPVVPHMQQMVGSSPSYPGYAGFGQPVGMPMFAGGPVGYTALPSPINQYNMQPVPPMYQVTPHQDLNPSLVYDKRPLITQPFNYPVQANTADNTSSAFYPSNNCGSAFYPSNNCGSAFYPSNNCGRGAQSYIDGRSDSIGTNPDLPVQEKDSMHSLSDYIPVTPTHLQTRIQIAVENSEELSLQDSK